MKTYKIGIYTTSNHSSKIGIYTTSNHSDKEKDLGGVLGEVVATS